MNFCIFNYKAKVGIEMNIPYSSNTPVALTNICLLLGKGWNCTSIKTAISLNCKIAYL